ncbi:MAG: ABC transporter substrate-binding protein [Ferrovibrionaceae bacterium]
MRIATASLLASLLAVAAANPAGAQAPRPGGTLTVGLATQAQCIDPQQDNYGYGSRDGRQLVDSLTDQDYDDPTRIVPWLATSWTVGDEGRTYVFRLRDDVTFSDGSKFDAQVVKDNFETLSRIPGAAGAAYFRGLKAITVENPTTLRIEFTDPNIPFLQASSTAELGIVSPATVAKTAEKRCFDGVAGSGPFVIESIARNEKAVFVKRQGYGWPSALRRHKGDAYLDRIVYRVLPEASVRNGALLSNQVDLIQNPSFQDAVRLTSAGYDLISVPSLGLAVTLVLNTSGPVLQDKAVRLALRHGINRQEVVDIAYSGLQTAATGLLTPKSANYLNQSAELAFDPQKAARILDEAGWKPGPKGVRAKDGKPLAITVSFFANPLNQAFLEVIQQQLRDLGFDFALRPLNAGQFDEALLAGRYDLHRWAWFLADPDVLRAVYSTKTLNRFRLGADNPIDGLLDAQRAATDPAERRKLTDQVQKIIIDEAYGIPVFDTVGLWGANRRVRGVTYGPGSSGGPNQILYDAWLADNATE